MEDNKNNNPEQDEIESIDKNPDDSEYEKEEKTEKPEQDKKEKVFLHKSKKKEESKEYEDDEEDEEEEYEYDDDDEEYEEGGKGKVIIVAVIVAALIAAGGVITYQKIKSNNDQQRQEIQEQTNNITATPAQEEPLQTETEDDSEEAEDELSATPVETQTPIPTSTPKPLPTETPTPTPFQDATVAETAQEVTDEDETILSTADDQQEAAGVIFLGDSRFRAMANIATGGSDLWECSSSGDYSWMTTTAFSDVDKKVGNNTKVFINMGINDILNYQAYASAINAKAQEWQAKGASVYFVAVGPVSENSTILNTDISTFNTYMYNNLNIPFIDAYNYLVETGFETTDGQTYTDTTCSILYSYLNGLIGR